MIYKRYIRYLLKYKLNLFLGLFLSLIAAGVTISPIFIIQYVVKSAFEEKNYQNLMISISLGLLAIVLIFLFTYLSRFLMEFLSKRVIYKIRGELFNKLMYLPVKFYKDERPGNIISIATNDISELQYFTATSILNLIKEPIVIMLALAKMFFLNFTLTLAILLLAPVFVLIIQSLSKKVRKIETRIRKKLANLTSFLHQAIYGINIIKVFTMEKSETHKFAKENENYLKESKRIMQYINLARPLVDFIGGLGVLFLLGFGGYLVIKGKITTSELTALVVALTTLSLPIKNLSETMIHIRKTYASLKRIFGLMDTPPEQKHKHGLIKAKKIEGNVRFENVEFKYDENTVLKDISFNVPAGSVVAIMGYSGVGKTTLVNLISGLIMPTQGKVIIDGYDIQKTELTSLRKNISMVTQESIVFSGTILENIICAKPDASMEEIVKACEISNCMEFIEKLPDKFETYVGDRGVKLSGGQAQRLTLARAIIKKPAILILDEATSSLDSEAEKLIQEALGKIIKNQTTFIISHRLSTVFNADIIYVIDKAGIAQKGAHEELVNQGGIYKKLYDLQFDM